jgi:hypothetical protein
VRKKGPRIVKGSPCYPYRVLYWGEDGKRCQEFYKSQADAKRRVSELRVLMTQAGVHAIAAITPERLALLRLAEEMQERLAPYGIGLEEAFRRQLELLALERSSPPVGAVVERLLDAKAKEGKSSRWLRDLRSYLGEFVSAGFGDRPIATIRRQEIAEYLDKAPSLWVRYHRHRALSTLFSFAQTREWLRENPLHGLPVAKPTLPEIRTYSPEEARRLLFTAREKFPELIPYLALGFFAGVRRAELERLDWKDINGRYVRVSAGRLRPPARALSKSIRPWPLGLLRTARKADRLRQNP